jgi:serine/threonine-protein kinase
MGRCTKARSGSRPPGGHQDPHPDAIADAESRGRFEREAKAAPSSRTPISSPCTSSATSAARKTYIVMEYLEGTDVAALISGSRSVPLAEALDIVAQLCRALDFAHEKGVVHRDVKPANLRYLDDGQIKIMDFGIARVEGSHQITKSGVMIGTLHYMSPEQIRGEKLDGRTDIFSAGCILYELLAGVRPFSGESATSILYNIVHETPKPVIEKNPDLPQEVQRVIERALSKKPEDRFATAGEMAKELRRSCPSTARPFPGPPPPTRRVSRSSNRSPRSATGAKCRRRPRSSSRSIRSSTRPVGSCAGRSGRSTRRRAKARGPSRRRPNTSTKSTTSSPGSTEARR